MSFIGLHYFNDFQQLNGDEVLEKVQSNTHLSFSFIALLVGSAIITTLGLLLNATPIVIGGMIISPLMWPLVKIALGISYAQTWYIRYAFVLLLLSIVITLTFAGLITLVSPIKSVTDEILARTTPTLLDLVVAIVAGGIAALAITRPRISDSLAGVAIATALTPPLCAAGIGLALLDFSIFWGSFLLFFANVIAIVFIATVMFYLIGIRRATQTALPLEGVLILVILLCLTALPLYFLLRNYSFKTSSYSITQDVLSEQLSSISPSIHLANVKTNVSQDGSGHIAIDADIYLPEDTVIDYRERLMLISELEKALGRSVDLRLRLQRTIDVVSETDIENENLKEALKLSFINQLEDISTNLSVDSLQISLPEGTEDGEILVTSVVRGNQNTTLTTTQLERIENNLSILANRPVVLTIEIIPRTKLKSVPEVENELIAKRIETLLLTLSPQSEITSLSLSQADEDQITCDITILAISQETISEDILEEIKQAIHSEFEKDIVFHITLIEKKELTY